MSRAVSAAFRNSAESSNATETYVVFATVTHPNLAVPVTVNNDVVDYIYNGNTYLGVAFTIGLLSDDDSPQVRGTVSIPNVSAVIGETLLGISAPPRIKIELIARSDFNDDVPRRAISVPVVELSALDLFLRNVVCNAMEITADIVSYDIATEPWPKSRATPDLLPGMFR